MKCPLCITTNLQMTERSGVEIDYCPECRGVWLDRGELDKIIERSSAMAPPPMPSAPPQSARRVESDRDRDHYRDSGKRRKKKDGWLEEIFDIFD